MQFSTRSNRLRRRAIVALSLAAVLVACASQPAPVFAQLLGANVSGVVTDESGASLPGVTITVTNRANGTQQVLVTSDDGKYRAVALQPAPYEIAAELAGFTRRARQLTLTVGAEATADFQMGVATLEETVTVVGDSPLVEVSRAQPSSVVVGEQVASMPVLDRNFLTLAQLLPGSAPDQRPNRFSTTKFGGSADQRNAYTTLIDGGDIDDAIQGNPTINMSQDAVQEFKVFRNQFDAQYGNALSAVVTVVTKSGTNDLHGTGFYFGRDDMLNARNAFAPTKPPYRQSRVGGSLGGPLRLNKTHFFSTYEFNDVDEVKIIALPASNPFATRENGVFPSGKTNHLAHAKVDHRFNDRHAMLLRYAYDNQFTLRSGNPSSDSRQGDDYSRAHSVVAEETWILSDRRVNNLRLHVLKHDVGTEPHSFDVGITRPSIATGQAPTWPQYFPRTRVMASDTLYVTTSRHDLKLGGDITFASHSFEAHFNESGQFQFTTDAAFNINDSRTWPISLVIQNPGTYTYKSKQIAAYVQDTWRVADRVRLNLGLRYDLDTNLRLNDFFDPLLDNPAFAGLDQFIGRNRGNDFNNLQPRLGATWDVTGNGTLVARGGWGVYVTRNRPYFQMTTQDRTIGGAVRIEDPQRLSRFPDITAVLGGQSIDQFLAAGGVRSLFLIADDYVLPYQLNTTAGLGWQLTPSTSFEVDYVHGYGTKQLGSTDYNLPASGAISATNPRPVRTFSEVKVMENFTDSWYDALETQLRTRIRGADSLQVSYTLSRAYRDGVDHYQTYRGTMRTPDERGYSGQDTRHNLAISGSATLPGRFQFSGIVRALSGSPYSIQAGFDIDGDGQTQNDRPAGLPITVGREDVEESLRIINDVRVARRLAPIDASLLELEPYVTIDLRLTRGVSLGASRELQIFVEGYNVANRVNLSSATPNGNINAASFLVRRSAADARQIQWGARFVF